MSASCRKSERSCTWNKGNILAVNESHASGGKLAGKRPCGLQNADPSDNNIPIDKHPSDDSPIELRPTNYIIIRIVECPKDRRKVLRVKFCNYCRKRKASLVNSLINPSTLILLKAPLLVGLTSWSSLSYLPQVLWERYLIHHIWEANASSCHYILCANIHQNLRVAAVHTCGYRSQKMYMIKGMESL